MRFDYWPVIAVPHAMSVTSIGIGVIVMDPRTEQIRFQFREDSAYFHEYGNILAVRNAVEDLTQELTKFSGDFPTLGLDHALSAPAYLDYVSQHWAGFIRLAAKRGMDAPSIEDATQMLFDVLINPPRRERNQEPTLTQLRSEARRLYRSAIEGADAQIATRPEFRTKLLRGSFDLGVVNHANIVELHSSFTLNLADPKAARNNAEAWNYRVEHLRRERTAQLYIEELDDYHQVSGDTPITVSYISPREEKQQEVLESLFAQWTALDITPIERCELERHTRELNQSLLTA